LEKLSKDTYLRSLACTDELEKKAREEGFVLICGTDSVGDGSLWGPVTAAACILPVEIGVNGLRDSKLLSPAKRVRLAAEIKAWAISWSIASIEADVIDNIGIKAASELAMYESIHGLSVIPDFLMVDGNAIDFPIPQVGIPHGDALSVTIAAASILAKVERNAIVAARSAEFPQFSLSSHYGYGTAAHMRELETHGPTPHHRKSFAPVRRLLRAA
jgi:ribonuclease HII